jgi:predicted outer membrane protein
MRKTAVCVAALAVALAAGCNRSHTTSDGSATVGTAGRSAKAMSSGDLDLVRDVAKINTADLELGRLASDRGGADVKQFAQMMVRDHTDAGAKLQQFAAQRAIDVPAELDSSDRDLRDKLSAKQGLDFDREYSEAMVDAHQKLVDKLASRIDKDTLAKSKVDVEHGPDTSVKATAVVAEKSDDPNTMAVNEFAAQLYPVAYAHLQAAKALRDGVNKRSTN